jgi:YaiO family outer membrane protein
MILHKVLLVLMTILTLSILTGSDLMAQEIKDRPRRIEASFSFENLNPHETYGDWNTGNLAFYNKVSPDFTYFVQGSAFNRNEGNGGTGTIGAYKDWADFFYTYTAITAGTNSTYLPKFRADHDFNFKVGPNKMIVLTLGGTFIDYFNDHRDLIISGGPTLYLNRWVLQYRLFHNESNPGSIGSFSQLFSIGYGEEGLQWTYLNVSFGKQAYLATSLATTEAIDKNSLNIAVQHRHWLGKNYGIFGDTSYFKLQEGYEKFGISLGVFYEF